MKVSTLIELLDDDKWKDYMIKVDSYSLQKEESDDHEYTTPFKITVDDKFKVVYIKCQAV